MKDFRSPDGTYNECLGTKDPVSTVSTAAPPGAAVAIRNTGGGRGHPEAGSDTTGPVLVFFYKKTGRAPNHIQVFS